MNEKSIRVLRRVRCRTACRFIQIHRHVFQPDNRIAIINEFGQCLMGIMLNHCFAMELITFRAVFEGRGYGFNPPEMLGNFLKIAL